MWTVFQCVVNQCAGLMLTSKRMLQREAEKRQEPKVTRIIVSRPAVVLGRGGDICRCGVMRPVNRGFGYSWTFSPHLRLECTGLAFQTLSPVTRGTPAALESTAPCRQDPLHPPLARHHTRPWESCLEREDEDGPSGRLQPPASQPPYCLPAPN